MSIGVQKTLTARGRISLTARKASANRPPDASTSLNGSPYTIRPIDFASAPERAEHDALAGLVERILSARRADPVADTGLRSEATARQASALARHAEAIAQAEAEIDQRVYRLYALTPDEIQLVEESAK